MKGPDTYRTILAGIVAYSSILACTPKDISVNPSPSADKGPGEMTLRTSKPNPTIIETLPPGWSEHISLERYGKIRLRFQLPQEWSFRDEEQEIIAESKPTRDLTQMARIQIVVRRTTVSGDTFAEQFAGLVDDKSQRSSFKYMYKGQEVMSYVRQNPTTGQEEQIFGFTIDGVGVGIKISAPSSRFQNEKNDFQHFLNTLTPILK